MTTSSHAKPQLAPRKTKLDLLIARLSRKGGATIGELAKATGWQEHSVRGAFAGALRKRGVAIISEKIDGVRRYRIEVGQHA